MVLIHVCVWVHFFLFLSLYLYLSLSLFFPLSLSLGGAAITAPATDNQDTLPIDINEVPVPTEVTPTRSPEIPTEAKRLAFQRLRRKTASSEVLLPEGPSLPSKEKPSDSIENEKPKKAEVFLDLWLGMKYYSIL